MKKDKRCPLFFLRFVFGALAFFLGLGCSSAPKRPVEIRTLRNAGTSQLELANREADRGNYEGALELLGEARKLAFNTDDSVLIVQTYLSLENVYYFLGRDTDASAAWDDALAEAERAGDQELTAICRIYRERRRLLGASGNEALVTEARDTVQAALAQIKTNALDQALA
jgi:tetratricopeptide (TPR) repeat protein